MSFPLSLGQVSRNLFNTAPSTGQRRGLTVLHGHAHDCVKWTGKKRKKHCINAFTAAVHKLWTVEANPCLHVPRHLVKVLVKTSTALSMKVFLSDYLFLNWLLDENDHWKITHTHCWSNTLLTEPHGKGWFLYSYQRLPKKANETDRLDLWSKSWRLNDAEAFTVLPQIPVRCKNCWLLTWCKPIFYAILKRNEAQSAHAWVKVVNSWNTEGWGPGAAEVSGGKGGNAPFSTEQF